MCLRVIGFLRRLGLYSNKELRITFLKSRENWLRNVIDSVTSDSPYSAVTLLHVLFVRHLMFRVADKAY